MKSRKLLRKYSRHFEATKSIVQRWKHRRSWTAFYSQFIKDGDLCFDVGAHVGLKAEMMLALGARVICVEPQPLLVDVLRGKFNTDKRFNTDKNVEVVPGGLASAPGELQLSLCSKASTIATFSDSWKNGRFANDYSWDTEVSVSVFTLDSLVKKYGIPAFCKIDVEGFELEVLHGLTVPLRVLSIEYVSEALDQTKDCLQYLTDLGANGFNYTIGEIPRLARQEWTDAKTIVNEISASDDELAWGDIYIRFHR